MGVIFIVLRVKLTTDEINKVTQEQVVTEIKTDVVEKNHSRAAKSRRAD